MMAEVAVAAASASGTEENRVQAGHAVQENAQQGDDAGSMTGTDTPESRLPMPLPEPQQAAGPLGPHDEGAEGYYIGSDGEGRGEGTGVEAAAATTPDQSSRRAPGSPPQRRTVPGYAQDYYDAPGAKAQPIPLKPLPQTALGRRSALSAGRGSVSVPPQRYAEPARVVGGERRSPPYLGAGVRGASPPPPPLLIPRRAPAGPRNEPPLPLNGDSERNS